MSAPQLAFVLAAGQSKRMRSRIPKILHSCAGKALVRWSVDAALGTGARSIVVLSPDVEEQARSVLPPDTAVAVQPQMRGTGDAVRVAIEATEERDGEVFVLYGDTPTLSAATLDRLRVRAAIGDVAGRVLVEERVEEREPGLADARRAVDERDLPEVRRLLVSVELTFDHLAALVGEPPLRFHQYLVSYTCLR